jgi:hypothetical protein
MLHHGKNFLGLIKMEIEVSGMHSRFIQEFPPSSRNLLIALQLTPHEVKVEMKLKPVLGRKLVAGVGFEPTTFRL